MNIRNKIADKNIIFFSTQTFNLAKEIIKKLEEFGANVEFHDERPADTIFAKGIIRLKRSLYQRKIDNYYKRIFLESKKKTYHYLFVNRGEVVPEFFLKEFKKAHKECECIYYTWDSFLNHSHPLKLLKYFDKKFTFDPDDALKHGLNFRPLYFLDSYRGIKGFSAINAKYDLLFLGTAHSDRYIITNSIVNWCSENNLKSFSYFFIQGRFVYFYKKLFDKTFENVSYKNLSFISLKLEEILNLYKDSKVILDINHPGQKGLTMRTFEAIGAQKKMITTNTEVKRYSFYNPNNIFVIDRENVKLNKGFFDTEYEEVNEKLYESMSIEGWLKDLFVDEESSKWINGIN